VRQVFVVIRGEGFKMEDEVQWDIGRNAMSFDGLRANFRIRTYGNKLFYCVE